MEAWKAGCKGVTVYRDGCRSGVLVSDKEKTSKKTETFVKTHAPKRPKELPCDIYHISVKGEKYFVLVGLYEDQPYEVFAGKNGQIKKSIKSGILRKIKRGEYSVIFDNGETLGQISDCISDEEEAITRMTSTALRHGTDISFIVHQLEKTKGDMTGFAKSVARALKKYIPDGKEVSGEECATCGANLIRQDGCILCPSCGYTKCG
jgi:ribonucleoside-diphosphate reductase alpha chain